MDMYSTYFLFSFSYIKLIQHPINTSKKYNITNPVQKSIHMYYFWMNSNSHKNTSNNIFLIRILLFSLFLLCRKRRNFPILKQSFVQIF